MLKNAQITSDGSQLIDGQAGIATIIRISDNHIPVKILSYIGLAESSKAELWAFIIGLTFCDIHNINNFSWISDSKTTQVSFSKELRYWSINFWKNKSGNSLVHIDEWKAINNLTTNKIICCIHKLRSVKHRDLTSCDKASRWAARLGSKLKNQNTLSGKGTEKDPRYSWQVLHLENLEIENLKSESPIDIELIKERLNQIQIYQHSI